MQKNKDREGLLKHNIVLEPLLHTYSDIVSGQVYDSVSKVLGSISNEFNADLISWAVAKKQCRESGIQSDEQITLCRDKILEQWEKKRNDAASWGTLVHGVIEEYLLCGAKAIGFEGMLTRMHDEIFSKYKGGYSEQIITIDESSIAGTADYLGLVGRNMVEIIDFKTSFSGKEIEFFSSRNQFLKSPVDHLSDCSFSKYNLQMSCYAYMLKEQYNYKTRRMMIVYIPPNNPEEFKIIPVPVLWNDAKNIMRHYRLAKQIFELNDDIEL